MAEIIAFQTPRSGARRSAGGPAEILFFTGVRVEYHGPDEGKTEDGGRPDRRKRRVARKALSN